MAILRRRKRRPMPQFSRGEDGSFRANNAPGTRGIRHVRVNPYLKALEVAIFLTVYIVWSSVTFPKTSGWQADLRLTIEKYTGMEFPARKKGDKKKSSKITTTTGSSSSSSSSNSGMEEQQPLPLPVQDIAKHRIPCGLIVIDNSSSSANAGDEEVLPLATSAEVPKATKPTETPSTGDLSGVTSGRSTLHARALDKYPQLKRYVVSISSSTRVIPEGTFRLRMGSEESTIDASPPLWIIDDKDSGVKEILDLVLGTDFWTNHAAEFGSDEVYLSSSSSSETNSDETKGSKVMVPYLLMRSRPSFGTEL